LRIQTRSTVTHAADRALDIPVEIRPHVGAALAAGGAIACASQDQNRNIDVKMLRRIHGVRKKRSMATSLCRAVQFPSLLETLPESGPTYMRRNTRRRPYAHRCCASGQR
jgi:hypothetical protein